MQQTFRLVIDCPDQLGLVAAVSQFLADQNATIVEANHHTDQQTGRFFMRHEIKAESLTMSIDSMKQAFEPIAEKFQMNWKIADSSKKQKIVMLASHESHCLMDILHRWHSGELHCDIPCIISNHPQMKQFADWHNIPFHWVDFKDQSKEKAFAEIEKLIEAYQADLTVLARFMQIIPEHLCKKISRKSDQYSPTVFCLLLLEPNLTYKLIIVALSSLVLLAIM